MIVIAEIKTDEGKTAGVFTLPEKKFKTGSRGFYGLGKVEIGGKRYQTQIQLVEIGTKAAAENPAKELPAWMTDQNKPVEDPTVALGGEKPAES